MRSFQASAVHAPADRIGQLYRAQSLINDAVARATDFKALCEQVCRIGVEEGGIACVLVRLYDAATDMLLPVAFNGPHTGLIGRHHLPAHDVKGASAAAFQTAQRVVVDDMCASAVTSHAAAELSAQFDIHSAAAFPLLAHGKPFGTFAMFAVGKGFFDATLVELLQQTAAILGFAYEKLQAEAVRMHVEERLHLAMNASQSGVWDWDLTTGKAFLSDEYCRMFGYGPGEIEGDLDTFLRLVHPDNREKTLALLRQQWASGVAATDYEQRFICKDGSVKWVQMRATILRDAQGRSVRMVGTAIDLTETKEREQRILQLSRHHAAVGKINAAVARATDFDKLAAAACSILVEEVGFVSAVIRKLDTAAEELTLIATSGVVEGALGGMGSIRLSERSGISIRAFQQQKPVIVRDVATDPITAQAAATGQRLGVSTGASFPLLVGEAPFGTMTVWGRNTEFGNPLHLDLLQQMADAVAIAHAKLAAESAAAARERDMKLAQQAGHIGSVIIDLQKGRWTTSEVGHAVLGLSPAEWYPLSTFEAMLAPETRTGEMAIMRANIASGKPSRQDYGIIRPSDGARRWLRVITDSEFDSAGKPIRRIGTVQDVTEELVARQRIERTSRLYAALSKTNEAIGRGSHFESVAEHVCGIAVGEGGMATAAVRLYDQTANVLRRVAHAGVRFGSIGGESLPMEPHDGLAVDAFHHGHPVQANDLNRVQSPLGREAAKAGLTAAVSYPLQGANDQSVGTFTVFASDVQAFDGETAGLLQEIAAALSFAWTKYQADAALLASRRDLLLAQRMGKVGSMQHDLRTDLWTVSETGAEILGLATTGPHDMAQWKALFQADATDTAGTAYATMRANIAAAAPSQSLYHFRRQSDQAARWLLARVSTDSAADGTPLRRVGTIQDVTDDVIARQRIERLSQLYSALSMTNEAVVRSESYEALAREVCRVVVEEGKLISAVIRLYQPEIQALVEVAAHGPRTGALGRHAVPVNDPHGLAVQAFRHGRRVVVANVDEHPSTRHAQRDSHASGIVAGAAFPLRVGDEPIGTMTVFAGHPEALDDQMADLIGEIADSVAFARAKIISEQARRDADARMAAIVDSAMDAIITCDESLRIVVFNEAAQQMFGIPENEAIGQPLNNLLPERFRAAHPRWMRSFGSQSHGSRAMGQLAQVSALRSDGTEFPVEASISHTELSGKRFYTVIMRDITAKLANQRALAETERRYRSLVETSLNGVMLLRSHTVVYANPAIARILGFDDVVGVNGLNVDTLTVPEHIEAVAREIARLMQQAGGTMQPQLLRLQRRDGRLIETQATANSISVEGEILIQLELRDVTNERRALAELELFAETLEAKVEERTDQLSRANSELAAVNRDLESFSYSVAHDLRAPLRTMIGFSQLLEMDLEEGTFEQMPSHARRISASAKRMDALIDGLLAVARVTHGALTETEIDCNVLVAEVIASLSVPESVQLAVERLPVMRGDVPSIRQVWVNLLSNAVKYSAKRPQPRIEVGVTQTATECCFHVRDNGAGFDAAYADRLFGVFQRLHSQEQFEGTGVGLAIVRRIIERHGGRVWAEGRPNEGATFHFALPLARLVVT